MKGNRAAVELDPRLAEVLSVLHHAYELFNGWEETERHSQFYDENLERQVEEFDRFACRMIQHELDHLDGHLFVDRVAPVRKKMISRKLQGIEKGRVSARYKTKA